MNAVSTVEMLGSANFVARKRIFCRFSRLWTHLSYVAINCRRTRNRLANPNSVRICARFFLIPQIPHLAVTPQPLDDQEWMLDRRPDARQASIARPMRLRQLAVLRAPLIDVELDSIGLCVGLSTFD
jgi:hypothetical protein